MQVHTEDHGRVRIVSIVVSAIDASNAGELYARVTEETKGWRRVIVDLSQAGAIDGDGLAALCECWRSARNRGIQLTLCGLPARCRLAARLLRLGELMALFEDRIEAMHAHGLSLPVAELPQLALS